MESDAMPKETERRETRRDERKRKRNEKRRERDGTQAVYECAIA